MKQMLCWIKNIWKKIDELCGPSKYKQFCERKFQLPNDWENGKKQNDRRDVDKRYIVLNILLIPLTIFISLMALMSLFNLYKSFNPGGSAEEFFSILYSVYRGCMSSIDKHWMQIAPLIMTLLTGVIKGYLVQVKLDRYQCERVIDALILLASCLGAFQSGFLINLLIASWWFSEWENVGRIVYPLVLTLLYLFPMYYVGLLDLIYLRHSQLESIRNCLHTQMDTLNESRRLLEKANSNAFYWIEIVIIAIIILNFCVGILFGYQHKLYGYGALFFILFILMTGVWHSESFLERHITSNLMWWCGLAIMFLFLLLCVIAPTTLCFKIVSIVSEALFIALTLIERFCKVSIGKIRTTYRYLNETEKRLSRVEHQLHEIEDKIASSEQ